LTATFNLYANLSAWANQTYAAGNCVSNSSNAYRCIAGGTSTVAPSGTTKNQAPGGTSRWDYLSGIDYSGSTGDAMFTAAIAGLPGSITQQIIWQIWNVNGATIGVSSAGTAFANITTGKAFTSTNNLTITAAPGEGFRDSGANTPLAFNPAAGVSFTGFATAPGSGSNAWYITDANVVFDGLQFKDPLSTSISGIITCNGGTGFILRNCIFDGYSQSSGNYAMVSLNFDAQVYNCLFIDRSSGAAAYETLKTATFTTHVVNPANCTFISTNASTGSAYWNIAQTGCTVKNCAFFGYSTPIDNSTGSAGDITVSNCAFSIASNLVAEGCTDGGGNIFSLTAANQFISSTADFRITVGSSLLNAGSTDTSDVPSADDIYRTARPQGVAWDIGAYEYIATKPSTWNRYITPLLAQ
jgi:hypothetical protein